MTSLSYDLHKLTARLDRIADRLLRDRHGISYSRFLALFAIREGAASQRALADWLGQTEPSTSRMVGLLAEEGLLEVTRVAGAGNRRHLELTAQGAALVKRTGGVLEGRFVELVKDSGVSYASYQRDTQRLLSQLDAEAQTAPGRGRTA